MELSLASKLYPDIANHIMPSLPGWKLTAYKPKKNRICRIQHTVLEHAITICAKMSKGTSWDIASSKISEVDTQEQVFIYHAGDRVIHITWDDLDHLVAEIKRVHLEVVCRLNEVNLLQALVAEGIPEIPFTSKTNIGWESEEASLRLMMPSIEIYLYILDGSVLVACVGNYKLRFPCEMADPGLIERLADRIKYILKQNIIKITAAVDTNLAGNIKAIKALAAQNMMLENQQRWLEQV